MAEKMICTNECGECEYGTITGNSKELKVYCENKNKSFYFGQMIPCDVKRGNRL